MSSSSAPAKTAPAAAAAASAGKEAPAKEPTAAELEKENTELEAKIAALKGKLGITAAEEKEELARVKAIFQMFDRDGNGFIDRNEFELLAFECGVALDQLTPANLQKTFAAINPKGDGKITFDDFFKWLRSGDKKTAGAGAANIGMLQLKLQSRAWMKSINDAKAAKAAAAKNSKDDKNNKKAAPADGKKELTGTHFELSLGKVNSVGSGMYFDGGDLPAVAEAKRKEVNAPEGSLTILHFDLPLKQGYDEGQIGELAGILETLIASVPWNQIPLPVYQSHSVDIVDGESKDSKSLRVTLFSQLDVHETLMGLMGQTDGGQPLKDVGTGSAKFELPIGVSDLKDPNFRFTPDKLAFRLICDGKVNTGTLAAAKEAIAAMPPLKAFMQSIRNASAQFIKGFDLTFNFAELQELVESVPDYQPPAGPAGGPGARRRGAGGAPSGLQQMKMGLQQLASVPVADGLSAVLGQLPPLVQATGQAALYEAVRNNVIGLGRIHIQANDLVMRANFKGLDIIQLLPALN